MKRATAVRIEIPIMQVFTVRILLIALSIGAAFGIHCYDCNSHFDQQCIDPFKDYALGKVNCDEKANNMINATTATFCRKITQKGL
jgi:hypothetical protein